MLKTSRRPAVPGDIITFKGDKRGIGYDKFLLHLNEEDGGGWLLCELYASESLHLVVIATINDGSVFSENTSKAFSRDSLLCMIIRYDAGSINVPLANINARDIVLIETDARFQFMCN